MAIIRKLVFDINTMSGIVHIPIIETQEFGIIPKTVYKYLDIKTCAYGTDYSRQCLSGKYAWFSNPIDFNDPFDCSIQWAYFKLGEDDAKFIEHFTQQISFHEKNLTKHEVELLVSDKLASSKANPAFLEQIHNNGGNEILERLVSKTGMYSTCLINDNILLWSHYGNKHTGICIGLDTYKFLSQFPNLKHDFVRYMDHPIIEPFDYNNDHLAKAAEETMLLTKAPFWNYEVEYRFIEMEVEKRRKDISGSLKSLIFGMRTSRADRDYASSACKAMNPLIQFYEAKAIPFSYRLASTPIK